MTSKLATLIVLAWATVLGAPALAQTADKKPNIVIIWGDDIGQSDISAYTFGLMGFKTPNIDRVAAEGVKFTDYYAEQSCTAGRSAFITGQSVFRTGLSKVGLPGADQGLQKQDVTLAELLKAQGYATGQFGKNHLGDKDEFLPTNHGFDEFYGNLYHLNAEEEPELPDYPNPKEFPNFRKNFGPRGVIHSWALPDGTQKIEDTGPLTKKRMETIDDDIAVRAAEFIGKQAKSGAPHVRLGQLHAHALPNPCQARQHRTGRAMERPVRRRHDRPRQERRHGAEGDRRPRPRRQHDRHVFDRQRPAHEHLA